MTKKNSAYPAGLDTGSGHPAANARGGSWPRLLSLALLTGAVRHIGSLLTGWVIARWYS